MVSSLEVNGSLNSPCPKVLSTSGKLLIIIIWQITILFETVSLKKNTLKKTGMFFLTWFNLIEIQGEI